MRLDYALSIGFCPALLDTGTHCLRKETSNVGVWIERGCIPFEYFLKWVYSLKRPSSIAASTLAAAAVITFIFYPQTALWLSSPAFKTALVGLHHLLYITLQSTLTCLGARAWLRLSPEREALYREHKVEARWDFLA
jgi:hypothetical protein